MQCNHTFRDQSLFKKGGGGGRWEKNREGQGYFKLAEGGTIVFFWYKDKGGHMIQQDL